MSANESRELVGTVGFRRDAFQQRFRHVGRVRGVHRPVADVVDQLFAEAAHLLGEERHARRVRHHHQPDVGRDRVPEREVVLRLDVLHLAELIGQGVEALDRFRLRLRQVAGDGAVGQPAFRVALDVVARRNEQLPVEKIREVREHPEGVHVDAVAVLVQIAGRYRNELRLPRRPARRREHQRLVRREDSVLACEQALDVRLEALVRVLRDGLLVVGDRPDALEAVLAAVHRVGVAFEQREELLLLGGARVPGRVVEVVGGAELEPGAQQPLDGRRASLPRALGDAHAFTVPASKTWCTVPSSSSTPGWTSTPSPAPSGVRALPRRPGRTFSFVTSCLSRSRPPDPSR